MSLHDMHLSNIANFTIQRWKFFRHTDIFFFGSLPYLIFRACWLWYCC